MYGCAQAASTRFPHLPLLTSCSLRLVRHSLQSVTHSTDVHDMVGEARQGTTWRSGGKRFPLPLPMLRLVENRRPAFSAILIQYLLRDASVCCL